MRGRARRGLPPSEIFGPAPPRWDLGAGASGAAFTHSCSGQKIAHRRAANALCGGKLVTPLRPSATLGVASSLPSRRATVGGCNPHDDPNHDNLCERSHADNNGTPITRPMALSAVDIAALADRLAARGCSTIFAGQPETARDMTTASRTLRRLMKLLQSIHIISNVESLE